MIGKEGFLTFTLDNYLSVFYFFFTSTTHPHTRSISPRGGVSVITEKSEITTSYLLIQRAKPSDSGKYVCRWEILVKALILKTLKFKVFFFSSFKDHQQPTLLEFSFMFCTVSTFSSIIFIHRMNIHKHRKENLLISLSLLKVIFFFVSFNH